MLTNSVVERTRKYCRNNSKTIILGSVLVCLYTILITTLLSTKETSTQETSTQEISTQETSNPKETSTQEIPLPPIFPAPSQDKIEKHICS